MKHIPFLSLLIFFTLIANSVLSQEIMIISDKTGLKVEQVLVTNQKQNITALSNEFGLLDLSVFNSSDTLFFHHTSFIDLNISYLQALKLGKIRLKTKEIYLNEVVISATKWEENIEEIPNKIEKIDSKTIAFQNPQTSADLLKNTAGVYIQKSQMGGGSPMIRGFSANSILLVFDGIRMNNSIYRSGNLQNIITIDPFLLENSEVIFGPGSIVYGSDALGGVIDFHSKSILLNPENKLNINGKIISRYSSSNDEKTGHFQISISKKKWGSFTSISYNNFGNQIMGNIGPIEYERPYYVERINGVDQMVLNKNRNAQVFTAYNQVNLMQKIKYQANDNLTFDYLFYFTKSSDIPRYDRLIQMNGDVLKFASWYYGPQKWLVNSLILNYSKKSFFWDAFKLQFSSQLYDESRHDRRFGKNLLNSRIENLDILSLNADFNKKLSPDIFYYYGFEASNENLKSKAHSENIISKLQIPISTRYPDGENKYQTYAVYSAFKYKYSRKLDFSGGLRYSYVSLQSNFEDKTFFPFDFETIDLQNDALTASLGFVYRTEKSTRINLNLSTGFRSPNIDDIAKVFDSEPGSVVVPNPNLRPEYVYNVDLGIKQSFFDKKLEVETIAFYSYLDNAMVRGDFTINGASTIIYDGQLSNIQAIINTGFAKIYGLTAQIDCQFSEFLSWENGISWVSGYDNNGFSIRHAPPVFGNTNINLGFKNWQFQLIAFFNGEIAFEDLAPTEADKPDLYAKDANGNPYSPAWFTIDFKSAYKLSDAFSLHLDLENLLDKRYRTYSSGIAAAGRSYRLSLNYKF